MADWIILITDRARLGAPVYAVARARPGPLKSPDRPRRTMRLAKALPFPTRRKAAFSAKRLMARYRSLLFTPVEVRDGDFARRRPERVFSQPCLAIVEKPKGVGT